MAAGGEVLATRHCPNDWKAVAAVVPAGLPRCRGGDRSMLRRGRFRRGTDPTGRLVGRFGPSRLRGSHETKPRSKHDFGDARMLADLERVGYLPRVWLAPQERSSVAAVGALSPATCRRTAEPKTSHSSVVARGSRAAAGRPGLDASVVSLVDGRKPTWESKLALGHRTATAPTGTDESGIGCWWNDAWQN